MIMMKQPVQVLSVQFTLIPQKQNNFNKQYKQNIHLRVLVTLLIFILTWHQYTEVETRREKKGREMKRKKEANFRVS